MAEGAIYDFFDADAHTITKTPVADYYVAGVDYGTSNPCAFVLFGVNRSSKPCIWAEHEYYFDSRKSQKQKTNTEYSADFMAFCEEHLGRYWQSKVLTTYVDPSAESFSLQLKRDGVMSVCDAENDVLPGIACVSSMMKSGRFAIHATQCPNLVSEVYGYCWDPKAQEKGLDMPMKTNDHACDVCRYVLFSEFGDNHVDLTALSRM